jgi:signal transduction histidine kinase
MDYNIQHTCFGRLPKLITGSFFNFFRVYIAVIFITANGLFCLEADQISGSADSQPRHIVTSVAQFYRLRGEDYLEGCDFHLTGTVTLVDSNRDLVVLQDDSGAVALHFELQNTGLSFGQQIYVEGTNCCPYFAYFPDFPYRPTIREVRSSFEAPMGCGDFYLTRMHGYLHPDVSGEYNFWIASDNSSELWLSTDSNPANARKIAYIPRFGFVSPHDWAHYPSQHSESITLKAGGSYYIEAFQEQTTVGDNLSVAWQGPGLKQSVIAGRYLSPYGPGPVDAQTNGILREFWTNYLTGDLSDIGGPRPFQSVLSVDEARVRVLGQGQLPKPKLVGHNQPGQADNNYNWATMQGLVRFVGGGNDATWFELESDGMQIQVRVPHLDPSFMQRLQNASVRLEGVSEGVFDDDGNLTPNTIWISDLHNIQILENAVTSASFADTNNENAAYVAKTNLDMMGFYSSRGIITFNDRVLDEDYLVLQENDSAKLVSGGETSSYQNQLKVGDWVELGGAVHMGKSLSVLAPLVISQLGLHSMPVPIKGLPGLPVPNDRAGKWTELEGVVHSADTNGMLSVVTKDGPARFWISHLPPMEASRLVDATLRARGALLPNSLKPPLLLVPAASYMDIEEPAEVKPFEMSNSLISELPEMIEGSWTHRVKVTGEITYRGAHSFFLQDVSGGIRVISSDPNLTNGESVEVVGFPTLNGPIRTLTDTQARAAGSSLQITPRDVELNEALSAKQDATLVAINAELLAAKTNGNSQVLELQQQDRVFLASLTHDKGILPDIAPGSRIRIVGVYETENAPAIQSDEKASPSSLASPRILMRSPGDLTIIDGPPWWTWRRTAVLVGSLLTVITVTLLWVHLLHRRLVRQNIAQLEFSRRVLERLEDERRRIAVNLHDSLGQVLLAIKNQALLAIQRPPEQQEIRQRLDEISSAVSQALEEIRQITHGLRPYQLDRLGLTQAIRASVNNASENTSISFAVRVENIDGLFDKDAEIHVYRIIQEAVTNAVKHSAATEAAVVIKKRTTTVSLSIRDNGRGFDASKPFLHSQSIGYGLSGIAERVRILGGTFNIQSHPGEGTSLAIEISLVERKYETTSISAHRG